VIPCEFRCNTLRCGGSSSRHLTLLSTHCPRGPPLPPTPHPACCSPVVTKWLQHRMIVEAGIMDELQLQETLDRATPSSRRQAAVAEQQAAQQELEDAVEEARQLLEKAPPRDWFISRSDVGNLKELLARGTWKGDAEDAQAVDGWVKARPGDVLIYQQQVTRPGPGGKPVELQPFILGIQTDFMRKMAVKYGSRGPMVMDSTFGTNRMMVRGAGKP